MQALRAVLRDAEIGELSGTGGRSLAELESAVDRADAAAAASDYASLGTLVPGLLGELYAPHDTDQQVRTLLLVRVLHDAFYLARDLGHGDLAWAVSGHLDRAAAVLGEPTWAAVAGFVRSHTVLGEGSRPRALGLARRAADVVAPGRGNAGQVYGMCHLSAALQNAALGNPAAACDHLAEAEDVAGYTGNGHFAGLMFGPNNVDVWQLAIHLELGQAGRGIELARGVDVAEIRPPAARPPLQRPGPSSSQRARPGGGSRGGDSARRAACTGSGAHTAHRARHRDRTARSCSTIRGRARAARLGVPDGRCRLTKRADGRVRLPGDELVLTTPNVASRGGDQW